VPIEIALLHQAMALVALTGATLHAARVLSIPQFDRFARIRPDGNARSQMHDVA
jgi:hypothetical protein